MAKLEELIILPRHEIAACCGISEADDTKFIPSECLLYLVREHRSRPTDECAEMLFKTLMERFERGILKSGAEFAETESVVEGSIRDEAVSKFIELLVKDKNGEYQPKLDFFEIRFNKCVAGMRYDAKRKIYPTANVHRPVEYGEDGEPSVEFERAARGYVDFGPEEIEEPDYGPKLDQLIDELPPLQKSIVVMRRQGMKIESNEPGAVTISGILNKTPKTISKHLNLAFATLKKSLKGETA